MKAVLFDDAARDEAQRDVDRCETDTLEMFFADDVAGDPDGPQRFDDLDEAFASPVGSRTGLDLAISACTNAQLERVRNWGNI